MSQPSSYDVHVNTPLTNVSVAMIQSPDSFIARRVFPLVPVQHQGDRYYRLLRHEFNRDEGNALKRAAGTEAAGGGYNLDNTPTYFADVYAWKHTIADQIRQNVDPAISNQDEIATRFCTTKLLVNAEVKFASNYLADVWTSKFTGVSSSPSSGTSFYYWNDYTNSAPITDIRLMKQTIRALTGIEPNVLVVTRDVWDVLVDHPDILDRLKYGQTAPSPAMTNRQAVAAILELERIEVLEAVKTTSLEGTSTMTSSFIATKSAILVHSPKAPGLEVPTAGYTFTWTGMYGGGNGIRVKKYRWEILESDIVEAQWAYDMKLVEADLGGYFSGCIS